MSTSIPPVSPDPALAGAPSKTSGVSENPWKTLEEATPDTVRDASQNLEYKANEIINGR